MKKILRIIMMMVMIIGIVFSLSNFISAEFKSISSITSLQGIDYDGDCIHFGFECDLLEIPGKPGG